MKNFITNKSLWFPFIMLFALLLMFQSCGDEKEPIKWVDLRYRVAQDLYLMDANGNLIAEDGSLSEEKSFSIVVKSTDSWEVFGTKRESWYQISPDKGEAGESYTVTISCTENTELDDRMDTINVKSDYWIGKQFVLTQKGTAYLNADHVSMIPQEGTPIVFDVLSNQKWSAEVTEGNIWLSIVSGESGEADGQITVSATANTGEQRSGIVALYDRYGELAQEVVVTQAGVVLTPQEPENGSWFAIYEQEQTLVIPVESNAKWTVSKENAADDSWYDFETTSFDGSGELRILVSEHTGTAVRTGTILLATLAEEGATPLVKKIRFKQANPKIPVVHNGQNISGTMYGPNGLLPGRYNFYLDPLGEATMKFFFIWNGTPYTELRYHIINKKTDLSTTPWCSDVFSGHSGVTKDVDTSKSHVLSLEIQESVDSKGNSWIYTEWIMDGEVIAKATSDGISDANGTSDTWKVPYSNIVQGGTFQLQASGGTITLSKWEYVAPLVWGE